MTIRHRKQIRLRGYDYRNAGAYFVTICTHQRECTFGQVRQRIGAYLDNAGQRYGGKAAGRRAQRPTVGHPPQPTGQAFDVVGQSRQRGELGDALDQGVASDLHPPRRADRSVAVLKKAGMVNVRRPGRERSEVGQLGPDCLRFASYAARPADGGHVCIQPYFFPWRLFCQGL